MSVGAGCDYFSDSNHQTTRTVLVQGSASLLGASAFAAAMRFDDDVVGAGYGWSAGFGAPLAPLTQLRVSGMRSAAEDGGYHAWRIQAGAAVTLPLGPSAGLYYLHEDDSTVPPTNGVAGEGEVHLFHGLGLHATTGYARNTGGVGGGFGTLGLSGPLVHWLQWSAQVGLAQNRLIEPGQTVPRPQRLSHELPILGGGTSNAASGSTTTSGSVRSVLLGMRVAFP